jgi:ribonuclease HI
MRTAPKDMIKSAVDLFNKYMQAPVNEWDEYAYICSTRKQKRQRREYIGDVATYAVIEKGMRRVVTTMTGTSVTIDEEDNPLSQWRGDVVTLYIDGSYYSLYNVAAWSVIDMESNTKMAGGVPGEQSNNRAEMTALVAALSLASKRGIGRIQIMTDSEYTRKGAIGAERRLANYDLWAEIDKCMQQARVHDNDIVHVAAHNGNVCNGIADLVANNEAMYIANRLRQRVAYDPALDGWGDEQEDAQQPLRRRWVFRSGAMSTDSETNIM